MSRLQTTYQEQIVGELQKHFGYSSVMQVPRLVKITLNMGVGEAINDKKIMDNAVRDMTQIAGQKPIVTKARKSVAGFKIREEWPIGCKVTLRRERMYEFLDRLINVAIPRVRDFRGLTPKAFDGRGNYSMGVREQIIFPEIDYDKIDAVRGLDVTITTTARTDEEGRALLNAFKFPFRT
jgi:large subunit ribosomal protein L5